jgi:hypothetical protein
VQPPVRRRSIGRFWNETAKFSSKLFPCGLDTLRDVDVDKSTQI